MSAKNFVSYGDAETLFTGVGNKVKAKANQTQLATVEASTTASKAYSSGEYLVLGGVLYKVTANIAQGGTIVTEGAGKNVDLATVGGELNAINSNIARKATVTDLTNTVVPSEDTTGVKVVQVGNVVFVSCRTTCNAGASFITNLPTSAASGVAIGSKAYISYNTAALRANDNLTDELISMWYISQ